MTNHDNSSSNSKPNGFTRASLILWGLVALGVLLFFTRLTPEPLITFHIISVLSLGIGATILGYMGRDVLVEKRTGENFPSLWEGSKETEPKLDNTKLDDRYSNATLSIGRIVKYLCIVLFVVAVIQFIALHNMLSGG